MQYVETKKVVKVTEYVAFDGKHFEDVQECRDYESKYKSEAEIYVTAHCLKKFLGDDVHFVHAIGCDTCVEYLVTLDEEMTKQLVTLISICYGGGESCGELFRKIRNDCNEVVWIEEDGCGNWYYYGTLNDCLAEVNETVTEVFN